MSNGWNIIFSGINAQLVPVIDGSDTAYPTRAKAQAALATYRQNTTRECRVMEYPKRSCASGCAK